MTKTEQDIERDFYTYVKASTLGQTVTGSVYRSGMRPDDAETEDVVVKLLTGIDSQVQEGIVILNIYVPDVYAGSRRKVIDHARIATLQTALTDMMNNAASDFEYHVRADATPQTLALEGVDVAQHLIYARIRYRYCTE